MLNQEDFTVSAVTADNANAIILAGVPIESGTPLDNQYLAFSSSENRWKYVSVPAPQLLEAMNVNNITPVAGTNLNLATDTFNAGSDITRISSSQFQLQQGTYRMQFSVKICDWLSSGLSENVSFQLVDETNGVPIGPVGELSGFNPGSTVVCGVSIETVKTVSGPTVIAVETPTASGSAPLIFPPATLHVQRIK